MKHSIHINQKQAMDLGLNLSQAHIYQTIIDLQKLNDPVFCNPDSGIDYFYIPYRDISEELPLLGLKDDTIYRHISRLEALGLIERFSFSDDKAFNFLNKNHASGCLFCGYKKYTLHEHHYPIRRSAGGTETITLCPNCHSAFHALADFGLIRAIEK